MEGVRIGTFRQCSSLKSITLPASVEALGDMAFARSGLKEITSLATEAPRLGIAVFDGLNDVKINHLTGSNFSTWKAALAPKADVNGDGEVDVADITAVIKTIKEREQ